MTAQKVFVYFNLRRKLWSVKALEGPDKGRVILWAPTVLLAQVTPKVSQAGRQRVLRDKRKNVHAGLVGYLVNAGTERLELPSQSTEITYNPYTFTTFVRTTDHKQFHSAGWALLQDKRVHVSGSRIWGTYDGLEALKP